MLGFYTNRQLWTIPHEEPNILIPITLDGRNIWGKNILLAWGPRHVLNTHSLTNVWPLAMWKSSTAKNWEDIQEVEQELQLTSYIDQVDGPVPYSFSVSFVGWLVG